MYNPRWYKEERVAVLQEAIGEIGFGTLVTSTPEGVLASHIPMLVDSKSGRRGSVSGHIARGNAQWRETGAGTEALAIFMGPHAYVSPTWYETTRTTGKVVPTWDYLVVHARGPIEFFTDADRLLEVVKKLTEKYEAWSERPWSLADAPAGYIGQELKQIVGFEFPISSIEGKWKMSQNRPEADKAGAVKGLRLRAKGFDKEVASEIEKAKASEP